MKLGVVYCRVVIIITMANKGYNSRNVEVKGSWMSVYAWVSLRIG